MTKATSSARPARQSHLRWVPLSELQVNPVAQREFRPAWAMHLFNNFDLDKFQVPHVNQREDGAMYIMEGQHGTWAYRQWIADDSQQIQVWLYQGLSEQEEAEFFLSLNDKKTIGALDKFKVAVTAGRDIECDIDRVVRANGCVVSASASTHGAISAVGTLHTIYARYGPAVLGETLRTISITFGDGGYERGNLIGIAMVLARYPELDRKRLVTHLGGLRNGSKGLIQRTSLVREQMGCTATEAAAAAVVDIYNTGRGGKKIPSWWKTADAA